MPSNPTSTVLHRHIKKLGRDHGVKIHWVDKTHPHFNKADTATDEIWVARITNQIRYAKALHEIGHLCSKSKAHPAIYQEGAAWAWAKQHAVVWTPCMQRAMIAGLRSYLKFVLFDGQHLIDPKGLKWPPRAHPFWQLLKDEPEVSALFAKALPPWLSKELLGVPWGAVLAHPQRPSCKNCAFWQHAVNVPSDLREKTAYGQCLHQDRPLGVELTPAGALCGVSWLRKQE